MGLNAELADITEADSLAGGELIYIEQGGNSRRLVTGPGIKMLGDTGETGVLTSLGGGTSGIAVFRSEDPEDARNSIAVLDTVTDLINDAALAYSSGDPTVATGDIVEAGGYRYEVAASGAVDHQLTTAGSVKLYVRGDFPSLAQFGGLNDGATAADDALDDLLDYGSTSGNPVYVVGTGYLLTAEHSIPASVKLFGVTGPRYTGGFVVTDDTLRSVLYSDADDVELDGIHVEMPETVPAGFNGFGVLLQSCSGPKLRNVTTLNGKYGIGLADVDDAHLETCVVKNSNRWGFLGGGIRNVVHDSCRVEGTANTSASDCFKLVGVLTDFSTRSTQGVWYDDCWGQDAAGGQVMDINSQADSANDVEQVYVNNLCGRDCSVGWLEIKTADGNTAYSLRDVHVDGGHYKGLGTEITGLFLARRIDNVTVKNFVIADVLVGVQTGGNDPGRRVVVQDFTIERSRQEGVKWQFSGGNNTGNKLVRPRVIDPNWGQGASTYAGIFVDFADDTEIVEPTAQRTESPSGSAHSYGIDFGTSCGDIRLTGLLTLSGHATAPLRKQAGDINWPVNYYSDRVDISTSDSASSNRFATTKGQFVACELSLGYAAASNVERDITASGRGTGGTTTIGTIATSATGSIGQFDTEDIDPPVLVPHNTRPMLQWVQAATTRPGSPTGEVIIGVHGYYSGTLMN